MLQADELTTMYGLGQEFKHAVLAVWMSFLSASEVAFIDGSKEGAKLHIFSGHRDQQIIWNKVKKVPAFKRYMKFDNEGEILRPAKRIRLGKTVVIENCNEDDNCDQDSLYDEIFSEAQTTRTIKYLSEALRETKIVLEDLDLASSYSFDRIMPKVLDMQFFDSDSNTEIYGNSGSEDNSEENENKVPEAIPGIREQDLKTFNQKLTRRSQIYYKMMPKGTEEKWKKLSYNKATEFAIDMMSINKTLAMLHLALRHTKEGVFPSDLAHLAIVGQLSYMNAAYKLPSEFTLLGSDQKTFSPIAFPTPQQTQILAHKLMNFIRMPLLPLPNLIALLEKFIVDFNLPLDLVKLIVNNKEAHTYLTVETPGYDKKLRHVDHERKVMALILVVLRKLFVLDGKSEKDISQSVRNLQDKDAFIWDDWENQARLKLFCLKTYNSTTSKKYVSF